MRTRWRCTRKLVKSCIDETLLNIPNTACSQYMVPGYELEQPSEFEWQDKLSDRTTAKEVVHLRSPALCPLFREMDGVLSSRTNPVVEGNLEE